MAANFQPLFTYTPINATAVVTAANTDRTGATATNLVSITTATADGSKIFSVTIKATGTTTAGCVRLFILTGATRILFYEQPVAALVPGAGAAAETYNLFFDGVSLPELLLANGQVLQAGSQIAETFHVTAIGGHYELV